MPNTRVRKATPRPLVSLTTASRSTSFSASTCDNPAYLLRPPCIPLVPSLILETLPWLREHQGECIQHVYTLVHGHNRNCDIACCSCGIASGQLWRRFKFYVAHSHTAGSRYNTQ